MIKIIKDFGDVRLFYRKNHCIGRVKKSRQLKIETGYSHRVEYADGQIDGKTVFWYLGEAKNLKDAKDIIEKKYKGVYP